MANKPAHNKKILLQALEKTMGVVTTACEKSGVPRRLYYEYYNNDPEFKKDVDELANVAKDFAESKLMQQINKGDTTATIFYLKTKAKDRGYIEKQIIDNNITGAGFKIVVNDPEMKDEIKRMSDRTD